MIHRRKELRALSGALLTLAALSQPLPAVAAPAVSDKGADDIQQVYCLSGAHAAEMREAIVVLGIASPGSAADRVVDRGQDVPLPIWRRRHPDQFERACRALIASAAPANALNSATRQGLASLLGAITVLLPVLFGAALTAGVASVRDRNARGRAVGAEVEQLTRSYAAAVQTYTNSWRTGTGQGPRGELEAAVREAANSYWVVLVGLANGQRWPLVSKITQGLEREAFAGQMFEGWTSASTEQRADKATALLSHVEDCLLESRRIAEALRHPLRPRRRLR